MKFDIISIFPEIFDSWTAESIMARSQKKKLVRIKAHDLRRWTKDVHKTVDDRPFGGGLGMVLKVEPIFRAVQSLRLKVKSAKCKVILFSPRGEKFNQRLAYKLSKLDQLIMICGRYEGVDERVARHIADMELSVGPYDLMGGEVAAMTVMETIARLIPGVLGKHQLLKERVTKTKGFIEYPQYTRPEVFIAAKRGKRGKGVEWRVPRVLLSGHHKEIGEWKKKYGKTIE